MDELVKHRLKQWEYDLVDCCLYGDDTFLDVYDEMKLKGHFKGVVDIPGKYMSLHTILFNSIIVPDDYDFEKCNK